MDCRTFHQKLDDYLENGLDFSGRFGMERHAQQCISCGKEMADAQQLRQMVSELHRVKAPANFESSLLREIAIRKTNGRFWGFRKYWIYGFEWPSWRKVVYASSGLAVLACGIFYLSHRTGLDPRPVSFPIVGEPAKIAVEVKPAENNPGTNVEALASKEPAKVKTPNRASKSQPRRNPPEGESPLDQDAPDMDYVEYMMPGPDNYAVPVRLPKRIPMRYSQMSEEYFIRNVSH